MSVDPSSLSIDIMTSMSPRDDEDEVPEAGPSRKRPRTSQNSEERKEARAHRNRIAAQNSRDRRKAQFSYLERRVTELEEENRQLRAGLVSSPPPSELVKAQEAERELAKDRENEELRQRIKSLEKGWDTVMKALAAQGLAPTSTATTEPSGTSAATAVASPTEATTTTATSPLSELGPIMSFPISPAPSHTSLEFDMSPSTSFLSSPSLSPKTEQVEITRHLAAGDLERSLGLNGADEIQRLEEPTIDDATMEDLFREILAPSPNLSSSDLPFDVPGASGFQVTTDPSAPTAPFPAQVTASETAGILGLEGLGRDGADETTGFWNTELEVDMLEMDRILELLPAATAAAGFPSNLEWADADALSLVNPDPALVGVF